MTNQKGEAYAFFKCNASYEQITKELPRIRYLGKTPSALELSLFEGFDKLKGKSPELDEIVDEAKDGGMRYALKASLNGSTNKTVADEMATILYMAHTSQLYRAGEKFWGQIIYEENGGYVFREKGEVK